MAGAAMSLDVDLVVARGQLDLRVELEAPAGAVTAVLGPNGSGKSTLLGCITGQIELQRGTIVLGGRVLDRTPEVHVAPAARRVGVVYQDVLLFPRLGALDNVAFGPRCRGVGRGAARETAAAWLAEVGAAHLASRRPGELSGGEAQRVALARALATEPEALLLDEPLSALDVSTRMDVRRELRRHLGGFAGPTVLVTHDPLDVLALAERVVVLEDGRVSQSGSVAEVTRRPRTPYVAGLIGTNLLHGTARGTEVVLSGGATLIIAEPHDGAVFLTVDPAAIALHLQPPEGSPRNRWPARVDHVDHLGGLVRVQLAGPVPVVAEVTVAAAAELGIREGADVWASTKATEVLAYSR
jgi:molybdate transport system ATP-binding protein